MVKISNKTKIDAVVISETAYIAAWVAIFSTIMEAVFLVIGIWDYTVLLGNLLSACATVLNFFLMGMTVQNALGKDEKDAKQTMKASQGMRSLMLFIVALLGILLDCFNTWAVFIPFFFPRLAVSIRPLLRKKQ